MRHEPTAPKPACCFAIPGKNINLDLIRFVFCFYKAIAFIRHEDQVTQFPANVPIPGKGTVTVLCPDLFFPLVCSILSHST